MKIILSLNTDIINVLSPRPDIFEVVLKQYFYSISLAQKFYGYENVILHTDRVGSSYFTGFVNIKELPKSNNEFYLFSEPKIEALYNTSEKCIHIDGDLFLQNGIFFKKSTEVVAEHCEANIYESHYKYDVELLIKLGIKFIVPFFQPNLAPINMGIIHFKSDTLLFEYLTYYYEAKKFLYEQKKVNKFSSFVDVVIEQYLLACLLNKNNITVEYTNEKNHYEHWYGKQKFYKINIQKVESELKKIDSYKSFSTQFESNDKTNMVFRYFPDNE